MMEENGSLRATSVARAQGGLPPRLEEDGRLRVTPVTQLKSMAPKPEFPVSLEAMDEAVARSVTRGR